MLGFTQTVPNNIKGFSGFTLESLSDVIVIVKDENGDVVEEAAVVVNSEVFLTNSLGMVEFDLLTLDPYTITALKDGYNSWADASVFQGGTLIINAIITLLPEVGAQGTGGDIFWSPVCNSFRFYDPTRQSFYDNQSQNDLSEKDYMYGADYCQKVEVNETRSILIHSNAPALANNTMTLHNYETGALVATLADPTLTLSDQLVVDTLGNEFLYNVYAFTYDFITAGNYFLRATRSDIGRSFDSEPITVGSFPNTQLIEFRNWTPDSQIGDTTDHQVSVRIEAQLFRRMPTGTKNSFQPNDKSTINTSQRNSRGILLQSFALPPYLHECLAYGFSMSQSTIKGGTFYSENGYQTPTYINRYNLANAEVALMTTRGFNEGTTTIAPTEVQNLVQDNGDQLIQDNGDNLITTQ